MKIENEIRALVGPLALFAALVASSGCAALDRVNDALYETGHFDVEPSCARAVAKDCGVAVYAGDRRGRGVITGARTVLTVAHVVGSARETEVETGIFSSATARVARRIHATPEDLVELELASGDGFAPERRASFSCGAPAFVLAQSGIHGWARGLKPGDSGSPVIDRDGAVVGLLVGLAGRRGVLARVAGEGESAPASITLAAHR